MGIAKYLVLTNTHDGSSSVQVLFTPIKVVCNNTLQMALQGTSNKVNIRHTKSVKDKLNTCRDILGISNLLSVELEGIATRMIDMKLNNDQVNRYLSKLVLDPKEFKKVFEDKGDIYKLVSTNKRNQLSALIQYNSLGAGQKEIANTVWGAYNTITGYQQNIKEYKSKDDKMEKIFFGTDAVLNQKAFNLALAAIKY